MAMMAARALVGGAAMMALAGCHTSLDTSEAAADRVRAQDLGEFPYNPLVFHLDLSILAYQLYSQTLVWPFDPYYEDLAKPPRDREAFMDVVRAWAASTGKAQLTEGAGLDAFRGPGSLSGFDDNPTHDPIVYQYGRLHPWGDSITNADGKWTEYLTPPEITDRIHDVYVCTRTLGEDEGAVSLDQLVTPDDIGDDARDILMSFEGGTGDKGEPGQPPSHSLMGFALLRYGEGDEYDIHIAFRGSRSGSMARAAMKALPTEKPEGNPDWITDLGYRTVPATYITTTGDVSRGMSRSMQTIFPQLFGCLDEVVGKHQPTPPKNIYVTGHSLGGGLAQHFISAVMMGDEYGPEGDQMPGALASWPWQQAKLVTFGAPRVGDELWAETLTADHLEMPFFRPLYTYDYDAIGITDLDIIPRLIDPDRSAGYRVLIPTDPITTSAVIGGNHTGQTTYLARPSKTSPPNGADHEPIHIRALMTETLRDPDRIPAVAWAYHDMKEFNPDRVERDAGTEAEYRKLTDAVSSYHVDRDIWFDYDAFEAGVDTFVGLLRKR